MSGRGKRALVFALTWTSYASYYFGRKGFSVTKSTLTETQGLTVGNLAFIDTGYLAAYAVGQFTWGNLGDKLGSRRLLGIGMLAVAACVAAFGLSSGVYLFATFFILNGLFQATGWPGNVKAMGAWFTTRERGTIMGVWGTCYQAGGLLATVTATFLLGWLGWRWSFFGPAMLIATVGILILLFLPRRERTADAELAAKTLDPVAAEAAVGEAPDAEALRDVAPAQVPATPAEGPGEPAESLFRSPVLWSLGAAYFCLKLIRYSILFWLPFYLNTVLGYTKAQAGYLSISFDVGGIIGLVAVGFISDRYFPGRRRPVAAFMVVALALALYGYTILAPISTVLNFVGMALVGFCLFGPDLLVSGAAAQDIGGEHQTARAAGMINGMGSTGAVLQGFVTSTVSKAYGWNALFYVFIALALIACVALLLGKSRQESDLKHVEARS